MKASASSGWKRRMALATGIAWAIVACGGSVVNLGSNDGGAGGDGAGGGTSSGGSGSPDGSTSSSGGGSSGSGSSGSGGTSSGGGTCDPDASSPCLPSGTYTGYIESFTFPDGSDTVSMTIVANENAGAVTGTVTFGNAPMLAPPTSGDVGYPPGISGDGLLPIEGFTFTIVGGTYGGARLQVGVVQAELWKAWCELQTPVPQYGSAVDGGCGPLAGYGCLGNSVATTRGENGCTVRNCQQPTPVPVDCGKLALCAGGFNICTCTASSCDVPLVAPGGPAFDMQYTPGHLDGTIQGLQGAAIRNVHLTGG
ncbi:MAG TPA: hypothetical protein VIY73_15045 [Polyangiaceae bacterium]